MADPEESTELQPESLGTSDEIPTSGEIAEDMAHYLTESEQTPSGIIPKPQALSPKPEALSPES